MELSLANNLKVIYTGPATDTQGNLLGWHRMGEMLLCPQKYSYNHNLKLPQIERPELIIGTAFHTAAAHHYSKLGGVPDSDQLLDPVSALETITPPGQSIYHDQALKLWLDYLEAYPPALDMDCWPEIIGVEFAIIEQMGNHTHGQRADLVVQDRHGKVWIVDHKTVGGSGLADAEKSFTLSGQLIGLTALGKLRWGSNFGGVMVNRIEKKPGPLSRRFKRFSIPPAPDAVDKFAQMVEDFHQLVSLYKDRQPTRYPRVLDSGICATAYGGRGCDYQEYCKWGYQSK